MRRTTAATVVAGAAALAACSTGAPTTAEGGETFTLTIGAGVPRTALTSVGSVSDVFVPEVVRRVSEETIHEIEFDEFFGTYVEVGEELDAMESGQLDMGASVFPYNPSELPLHNLGYYVPFSSPDAEIAIAAFRQVYEGNEEFQQVYADRNQTAIAFLAVGNYGLGTNFPVEGVEDLTDRQVAGVGSNLEWLGPMDVVPVQAPSTEWYSAFQTGVYDGVVNFVEGFDNLRLYEVLSHFTAMDFGAVPLGALTVNQDTWETLPPEVQDIVLEVALEFEQVSAQAVNEAVAHSEETMAAEGMTVTEPSDELREHWTEALADLPQRRADEMDESGRPGSELISAYIAAQEELGHEYPVPYEPGEQQ
ncbi:C4-dicarboxylate TRAP transporter substrate-binding protein [Georgenia sp. Z1491]|uniref:C4-dicarboxylate TRAP transporter substrate-binding protein n=1 Tax=Georgenia sp. Z1491 TaxID=3416707 RepID=UPI003CEA93ED